MATEAGFRAVFRHASNPPTILHAPDTAAAAFFAFKILQLVAQHFSDNNADPVFDFLQTA